MKNKKFCTNKVLAKQPKYHTHFVVSKEEFKEIVKIAAEDRLCMALWRTVMN